MDSADAFGDRGDDVLVRDPQRRVVLYKLVRQRSHVDLVTKRFELAFPIITLSNGDVSFEPRIQIAGSLIQLTLIGEYEMTKDGVVIAGRNEIGRGPNRELTAKFVGRKAQSLPDRLSRFGMATQQSQRRMDAGVHRLDSVRRARELIHPFTNE